MSLIHEARSEFPPSPRHDNDRSFDSLAALQRDPMLFRSFVRTLWRMMDPEEQLLLIEQSVKLNGSENPQVHDNYLNAMTALQYVQEQWGSTGHFDHQVFTHSESVRDVNPNVSDGGASGQPPAGEQPAGQP